MRIEANGNHQRAKNEKILNALLLRYIKKEWNLVSYSGSKPEGNDRNTIIKIITTHPN